ncbi:MAG: hypothetical protein ABH862_05350 [Candidatus Omnitrophota bacterium]
MIWLEFLLCASSLTFFAYKLCEEGSIISDKTKISEGVIGMFFLAIATSFPEIITSSAAVFSLGRVGLGYGDIAGSIIVNLMILSVLELFHKEGRVLLKASALTRLTGYFAAGTALVLLAGALLRSSLNIKFLSAGRIGIESLIIIGIYLFYIGKVRNFDHSEELNIKTNDPFWKIWAKFIFFLSVVMILGVWMAKIGENIVVTTGLSQTFTGAFMLGVATSLPEIIVSFAAFRAASVDMAIGNILGSNLFDICIVPLLDALSSKPILGLLSPGQVLATGIVFVLCIIVSLGLFIKSDIKKRFSWDTGLIFTIGLAGFVLLYFVK